MTLNLSGGKLKIPTKKIAQKRTSVAKGRQYTADRTSYWGLREGWIRKTCHHKEKAQDLTEAYVLCLVLCLACSQTFFFLFFFFDYLVSAWAKRAFDSERGRKTKGYFLLSPPHPFALAVYKSPAVFLIFYARWTISKEKPESLWTGYLMLAIALCSRFIWVHVQDQPYLTARLFDVSCRSRRAYSSDDDTGRRRRKR